MYKILSIVLVYAFTQGVTSAPQHPSTEAVPIVNQQFTIDPEAGNYKFSYEAANGIKADEQGELKDVPNENNTGREPAIVVSGSYSYTADGQTYTVTYTADENGFRPTGQHIAPAITQALQAIAASRPSRGLPIATTLNRFRNEGFTN